jgi:recombination protein RecT
MNTPSRQVQQRPRDPKKEALREATNQLGLMRNNFLEVLPKTIPTDRFVRTASTLLYMKPELIAPNVSRQSLFIALTRCAADGLLPDGREATITLFNEGDDDGGRGNDRRQKQAVYMPMYQGLVKQIRNTGELKDISAQIVYQNDEFEHLLGDEEKIIHKACRGPRGEPTHAYCVIKTKDGGIYRAVLDKSQLEKRRMRSQMGKKNKGPWKDDQEEMWKKSAVKAVSKFAPKSAEMDRYLEVIRDQDDPVGRSVSRIEGSPLPDGEGDEALESQLFLLKSEALAAIGDSSTAADADRIWDAYKAECTKIDQPADVEVESRWTDHKEALKQRALK